MARGSKMHVECEERQRGLAQVFMYARWALQEAYVDRPATGWIKIGDYRACMVRPLSPTGGGVVVQCWERRSGRGAWGVPKVFGLESWCHRESQREIHGSGKDYQEFYDYRQLAIEVNQERVRIIQEESRRMRGEG